MAPVEPELLNELAKYARSAAVASKWYGVYTYDLAKTKNMTDSYKKMTTHKRHQRHTELAKNLSRIVEILSIVETQYKTAFKES